MHARTCVYVVHAALCFISSACSSTHNNETPVLPEQSPSGHPVSSALSTPPARTSANGKSQMACKRAMHFALMCLGCSPVMHNWWRMEEGQRSLSHSKQDGGKSLAAFLGGLGAWVGWGPAGPNMQVLPPPACPASAAAGCSESEWPPQPLWPAGAAAWRGCHRHCVGGNQQGARQWACAEGMAYANGVLAGTVPALGVAAGGTASRRVLLESRDQLPPTKQGCSSCRQLGSSLSQYKLFRAPSHSPLPLSRAHAALSCAQAWCRGTHSCVHSPAP